jgi:cell division protein FtsQ
MIREKRQKKKKRTWILNVILAVLIILVLAALAVIFLFRVKDVEIEGNVLYDDATITDWVLDDEYSVNSLYVYFKYKFVPQTERPFIDTFEVSLKNPQTLVITVYEKGMIGYIYNAADKMYYYFDKDGIVIERSEQLIDSVTKVTGIHYDSLALYEKIGGVDDSIFNYLLAVTQNLKKHKLTADEIELDDEGEMTLIFGTITVEFGKDENTEEKTIRLKKILPKLDGKSGTLFLTNWSSSSNNIIFRAKK